MNKQSWINIYIINQIFKIGHHLHSSFEKSTIERTIQCVKDRTEYFDYFSCRKISVDLFVIRDRDF
jgi:putative transposase